MANLTLWNIINGIAYAARNGTYTAGVADVNAMSLCEEMVQRAQFVLGTTYDAATAYSTTYYVSGPGAAYPAGSVAPSWDAAAQTTMTIKQIGG